MLHRIPCLVLLLLSVSHSLQAQTTIVTLPLPVTAVCAGTQLTVPFSQTGTVAIGNVYTVQLSTGSDDQP